METMIDRLDEMEEDLAARAFLFDHPQTYREAIKIAFRQMRNEISSKKRNRVALG
jgi:phage regulator Rha-like protein